MTLFCGAPPVPSGPCGLHARAKAVRFMTAAHFRLKRAFRQRNLPQPENRTDSKCVVYRRADAVKKSGGWRAYSIVSPSEVEMHQSEA